MQQCFKKICCSVHMNTHIHVSKYNYYFSLFLIQTGIHLLKTHIFLSMSVSPLHPKDVCFWLFSWDLTSESHLHHWMMVQTERTNCCCCCYVVTKGCDDLWKRYKQKYHGNSSTKRWKNMYKILVSKITHALYKSKRACMYGVCFLLFNSTLSYRYVAIACIFCGLKSFFFAWLLCWEWPNWIVIEFTLTVHPCNKFTKKILKW